MENQRTREKLNPKIVRIVDSILRERLAHYVVDRIEVAAGDDHDGDPVLFVDVYFGLSRKPIEAKDTIEAGTEVWTKLVELSESRFPHVNYHYAENQSIAGF
jgi:hypothetical protein